MPTKPRHSAHVASADGSGLGAFASRQVTNAQASCHLPPGGGPVRFELQLILDHGAAEHVLAVDAQDLKVVLQLLQGCDRTTFDQERNVLLFADLALK